MTDLLATTLTQLTEQAHYEAFQLKEMGQRVRRELGILNEEELCAAIGVKPNTLQVWRSDGQGPAYTKLGKGVFYHQSDVYAWALANKVIPQEKSA